MVLVPMMALLTVGTAAHAVPTTNNEFLVSCFKRWITNFAAIPETPSERDSLDRSDEEIKDSCLTSNFRQNWNSIGDRTDADPFLIAQDYQESWKTNVTVRSLSHFNAVVILGTGREQRCLLVVLKEENSAMKIDSTSECSP
jgi:hypothetical protein